MPAIITGDYSKYPETIRKVFPYLAGETANLVDMYGIYEDLFMLDPKRTDLFSKAFGPLLGLFQVLLEKELILIISRLTDKDNKQQPNLSLWCLLDAVPFAKRKEFKLKIKQSLDEINTAAIPLRKHRHKRIAHFDREITLQSKLLPKVTLGQIKSLMHQIQELLNLFYAEFENTSMLFGFAGSNAAGIAWISVLKAKAYDMLEAEGTVPVLEWRRKTLELRANGP